MERRTCIVVSYGMPHGSASGAGLNRRKYSGKELITFSGYDAMDYHARWRPTALPLFTTPDPMCEKTYPISLYAYCGGDPVNRVDPTGCIIEGVSKKDAAMAVEDFRAMFPGDEFANFRNLIVRSGKKQKGKSFAPISSEALSSAFNGVSLNEDQQALVEMVVNTINSDDVHRVEYLAPGRDMSPSSIDIVKPRFESLGVRPEAVEEAEGGCFGLMMNLCGEAMTAITEWGSLTILLNTPDVFVTNRQATLGHEVIGHGRSSSLGYTDSESQHVLPIQVENLILRNMGIPLFRDGTDHTLKTYIPNYMDIPSIGL